MALESKVMLFFNFFTLCVINKEVADTYNSRNEFARAGFRQGVCGAAWPAIVLCKGRFYGSVF